jgi:hypothetical protein
MRVLERQYQCCGSGIRTFGSGSGSERLQKCNNGFFLSAIFVVKFLLRKIYIGQDPDPEPAQDPNDLKIVRIRNTASFIVSSMQKSCTIQIDVSFR